MQTIKYFVVVLLFTLPAISRSQTTTLFFDQYHKKADKENAKYIQTLELLGSKYKLEERVIADNRLEMTGYFSSLDSDGIYDGPFVYYGDSGFVSSEGNFVNDKKNGEWKDYYPNLKSIWYVSQYKDDSLTGLTSYYKNGKIKREEKHDQDAGVTGKCYDETGKEITFTQFEIMPKPDYDYNKFLRKNLKYPKISRKNNVSGRVLTRFMINNDGTIGDVEVVEHVSPEIDAEAVRVISKMPPWSPGMQDDKTVKVFFTLPLVFSLQ